MSHFPHVLLQGARDFQFLRLQVTAGLDPDGNETLSYNSDTGPVTLPKSGNSSDPR